MTPFPVRASKDANVEGLKLHYTMGGHGPAVESQSTFRFFETI
jgi:hypothetical protein